MTTIMQTNDCYRVSPKWAQHVESGDLVIPMFSWWQVLFMSLFDLDFTKEKWTSSPDPEVRALNIFVPKYSMWQMAKMTLLQTDG